MTEPDLSPPSLEEAREWITALEGEIRRGILGQDDLISGLLIGLIANGHVLIEGVPGLGKTRGVHLLARACQMDFKRLQFTPDLLPADILGTRIYNQHSASFEIVQGPIFANFVLADEINRAPAKVQSALLETMQERQVTLGENTFPLPAPFLVFATQNPIEQEGTYPLPEAQLDRFLIKLLVTYPDRDQEPDIVRLVLGESSLPKPEVQITRHQVLKLQMAAQQIFIEDRLLRYATDIVQASRTPQEFDLELGHYIEFGASPRASISLALCARARALMDGREAVKPDDIKQVAPAVLRHRILLTYYADAEGVRTETIIDEILASVKVP